MIDGRGASTWFSNSRLLAAFGACILVASACDTDEDSGTGGAGAPHTGGTSAGGPTGGTSSGGTSPGGSANAGKGGAGKGGTNASGGSTATGGFPAGGAGAGEGGEAGGGGAGGGSGGALEPIDLGALVERGKATVSTTPRPAYGAVLVANDGERLYAVESRRDAEPGPFGLPWRSRFRLAAYDAGALRWAFAADPDDVVSDVAVHPSGDVTIAVLHQATARRAYDLVRLDRDGRVRKTSLLDEPGAPAGDYGTGPRPLFRMKSDLGDATVGGWVRLIANGEGLDVAFLSYVDVPDTDPLSRRLALGIESLAWESGAYAERWGRVVEGPHAVGPVAWAYDEFRWQEQAIRPYFARDDVTGDLVVGRTWNNTRCQANRAVFAEFTAEECVLGTVGTVEVEILPLAVTRFTRTGERQGTRVLAPDEDAAEQVAFALAASGGKLATAGAVVRKLADGSKRLYEPGGYVDYDGYIALYDGNGQPLRHHDFNLGHGEVFEGMRWTAEGIVAVGPTGWDRWQGGMSISRGADALLAWLSPDGARRATRVIPLSDTTRHYQLHDVTITPTAIVAEGFADAPMTHSADGGNDAARTFGALRVRLDAP